MFLVSLLCTTLTKQRGGGHCRHQHDPITVQFERVLDLNVPYYSSTLIGLGLRVHR